MQQARRYDNCKRPGECSREAFPPSLLQDSLGKLVNTATAACRKHKTLEQYLKSLQSRNDIHPHVQRLPHPAAPLLHDLHTFGAPAHLTDPPWSTQHKLDSIKRGPHRSATEHLDFLREEFTEMVRKRYWTVLPAAEIIHHQDLRLSPLGVVPQHDRRPRIICDYTFSGVNAATLHTGPHEAMRFGHALRRILARIVRANPKFGPVYLGKYDLADGYYRIPVNPAHAMRLACLLPTASGEEPLVAIPLVLPMGWTESAPYFCAATETIVDLVNDSLHSTPVHPPHRLDNLLDFSEETNPPPKVSIPPHLHNQVYDTPLAHSDVYIDDIIGLIQPTSIPKQQFTRHIFHTIDRVFRPLEPSDSPARTEPISTSKLQKGDGNLSTRKVILGWILDTTKYTLELTDRRLHRLLQLLDGLPRSRKRVPTELWQQVLGELRSMAPAIPGSRGLFSPLQTILSPHKARLYLTKDAHDFLDDFRWLAINLSSRPTRLFELVPSPPLVIGATDASATGLGGVFFVPLAPTVEDQPLYQAFVWQHHLPDTIRSRLISTNNPTGTITNSDLELAAAVAHPDVIASTRNISETTIATLHDNTPTVFWQRKGSTTTTGPAAYLLRLHALHARHLRYIATHDYIPGPINAMADDASRLLHFSNHDLLSHFNSVYPQPFPWTGCTLSSEMSSLVITALCKQRSDPESFSPVQQKPIIHGHCGWISAPSTTSIHGSPATMTQSHTSKSSHTATTTDDSHPATSPFDLAQWLTPCAWSDRHTSCWGQGTTASTDTQGRSTSASNDNSERMRRQSRPHNESSLFPSNSYLPFSLQHTTTTTTPRPPKPPPT